jgi:tripartite-type tricarboxylate transporter receptor subunit TctC
MNSLTRRKISLMLPALVAAAYGTAYAQSNRTGRLVVGVPAGSPLDSLARVLTEKLRVSLDMPMIVENKPGASGAIAADAVRQGPSDGSIIWLANIGAIVTEPIVNKAVVRFDPLNDFVPVAQIATFDIALAVGPAAPAKTLSEYLAMVKADPQKGAFGTPGANNLPHFFTSLLERAAGVTMINVPFKGGGEAMNATIGGQTAAIASGVGDLIQMHRAGRIRILATSGANRSSFAPEVPTFRESGFPIEGQGWFGIFVHKATPRDVVLRINRAANDALRTKELVGFMQTGGLNAASTAPEEFAEILKRDTRFWAATIQASGIKFD